MTVENATVDTADTNKQEVLSRGCVGLNTE